ncbi:hypothetical protein EGW08_005349, partial [Elysia chlorotica]
ESYDFDSEDLPDVIILDDVDFESGFESTKLDREGSSFCNNTDYTLPKQSSLGIHSNQTGKQFWESPPHKNGFPEEEVLPQMTRIQHCGPQNIPKSKTTLETNKKIMDSFANQKKNISVMTSGIHKNTRPGAAGQDIREPSNIVKKGSAPADENQSRDRQFRVADTLSKEASGWADLDIFHHSRQSLFRDGIPIHLRDDECTEDFDDELPSLTNSPDQRPALPVRPLHNDQQQQQIQQQQQQQQQWQQQQQQHQQMKQQHQPLQQQFSRSVKDADCPWTTTSSSDEELCHLVDEVADLPDEARYPQQNHTNMSGYEEGTCHSTSPQKAAFNSNNRSVIPRKALNTPSRAIYQTSGVRESWREFDDSVEEANYCYGSQSHTFTKTLSQGSGISTEYPMGDRHPSVVLSLTSSDQSHRVSLSGGSRHARDGGYLSSAIHEDDKGKVSVTSLCGGSHHPCSLGGNRQTSEGSYVYDVMHEDGIDKVSVDSLSQPRNPASRGNEKTPQSSNKDILSQLDLNCNEFDLSKGFAYHSEGRDGEQTEAQRKAFSFSNNSSRVSETQETKRSSHDLQTKSAEEVMQTPHRYGHVLAWNKASGSRSDQQCTTEQTPGYNKNKNTGFSFFNQVHSSPSDAANDIPTNLFDGIF